MKTSILPGRATTACASETVAALANRLDLDGHAHTFDRPTRVAQGSRYTPHHGASVDQWINHLRDNGMAGGTLVQPSFLGSDNRQLLAAIAQARAAGLSVTGSAVVDPDTDGSVLDDLAARGIVSVRLNWFGRPLPEGAIDTAKHLAALARSSTLAVELHVEARRAAPICNAIVGEGATLILDHFALARDAREFDALLETCGREDRVFVKSSAPYRLPVPMSHQRMLAEELLRTAVARLGLNHILWGTDWPHTQNESRMTFAAALDLNRTLRALATG